MDEITEYQGLLRLYAGCVESLKDFKPSDERLLECHPLAIKFFFHASTLFSLTQGTDVTPFITRPGTIFDHVSAKVLARALFETYLVFFYVFIDPKTDDEFEFRYCAWLLSGYVVREKSADLYPSSYQEQKKHDASFTEGIRSRIQETERFKGLKEKQKKNVLRGRQWKFTSWVGIAKLAGIGERYSGILYGLLSGYAHSDSLSALQINLAVDDKKQIELLGDTLMIVKPIISKMIVSYCDKFPLAKDAFKNDPEIAKLAETFSGALSMIK